MKKKHARRSDVVNVADACLPWLDVFLFANHRRLALGLGLITARAMVVDRKRDDEGKETPEITIAGVARHPNLVGPVRFRWETRIIDDLGLRMITERIGRVQCTYLDAGTGKTITMHFALEDSLKGQIHLRVLDPKGNATATRYDRARGRMNPRPRIDYER